MQLNKFVQDFLVYSEVEKNHSPKTIENYDHYLARFIAWGKDNGVANPQDINLEKVKSYRMYLNRLPQVNKKTQAYHIIALRAFLKYLAKNDIKSLASEKIELPKAPDRQITFLEERELEAILSTPKTDTIIGLRDKAILELLFSTGLRVSELAALNRNKISASRKEFSVLGKGGKTRVVFLSSRAQEAIKKYLSQRHDNDKALFVNFRQINKDNENDKDQKQKERVSRLSVRSIQRIVKKYAAMAGISKNITPHVLRHSFGTDLLRSGADIRSVQQLLGHSSITTTQIYTHVTDQHLREVHQAFHGRRRKNG